MQKPVLFAAVGGLTGLMLGVVSEKATKSAEVLLEEKLGVSTSEIPYLSKDADLLRLLSMLADGREHAPELFSLVLQRVNKLCAFYQNSMDRRNSTIRPGDGITVSSLRTEILLTLRNYQKVVLYKTNRDIKLKQSMLLALKEIHEVLDGIREDTLRFIREKLEDKARSQK